MIHRDALPLRTAASLFALVLLLFAAPLALAQVPVLSDTFDAPEPDINELDFGDVIEPLGDVNGDGVPDLAVGGPSADLNGMEDVGRAYVVSGADGSVIHTLESPTFDQLGTFANSIASLGDLNGDDVTDFVVTHQARVFDGEDTGAAYVYNGATGEVLYTITSPTPEDGGDFGSASANAGDVDGDGLDDILIGALNENEADNGGGGGQVHVLSGADGSLIRTLMRPFTPAGGLFSFFGRNVALVGDLDGGGLRDHAVFTRFEGQGRVDFFSAEDGSPIDFLQPEFSSGGGEFGQAIIPVPDLNGDGTDDILIGAPQAENISPFPPREGRGVIGLYDGATRDLIRQYRPGAQEGAEPGGTGFSLALGADLDGDGVRDFYAGSPGADDPDSSFPVNNGRVYVFSTNAGVVLGQLDSPNPQGIGIFGDEVATADLDGDGADELLVGAPRENDLDGRVYAFAQMASPSIVQDGSFEATDPETEQNPFWEQFGIPSDPICSVETCGPNTGIEAFDGDWFVFFGRSLDATMGFVQQEVTIPDSVNTLSFYLKIPVAETAGNVRARIDDEIVFEATQADSLTYAEYQQVEVDISDFADGETHTLRFQSATVSGNPPGEMFFLIDQVSITNQASTAAVEITPDPVNFGEVPIGTTAEMEATLSNPGGDPLVVSEVTITPAIQNQHPDPPITTDLMPPFTVAAGDSTTFTVSFAPTEPLGAVVEITFVSNASTSPDVLLAGGVGFDAANAEFSVDPDSLDFEVDAGEVTEAQTLTLSNTGDDAGTFAITTTITPPTARVPTTLIPADRLRPAAGFVRGEATSVVRSGSGGGIVTDGSFEATPDDATRDNPFWEEFSAQIGSPFCNEACFDVDIARTGEWAAIFGFDQVLGTDFIEQEVELEAQSYDLSFFYAGGTDRDDDGEEEAEGFFRILLDDEVVYELSAAEAQDFTLGYRPLTVAFDVEEAGTKTLRFELEQITANPEDDVMQIIFDDVSLAPSTLVLDVDPTSGTVEAGATQEIAIIADATQATPGIYEAEVRIDTNDPDAPTLIVPVTVEVEGVVVPPVVAVDPDALDFEIEQDEAESQTFTISNAGDEGAGPLTYDIAVMAARQGGTLIAHEGGQARTLGTGKTTNAMRDANAAGRSGLGLAHTDGSTQGGPWFQSTGDPITTYRNGGVTITHSESQEIVPVTAIACFNQNTGFTSQNSVWRVFDLGEFDLTGGLDVTSVDIGIEAANLDGGTVTSTVNLYSLAGPLATANLTLLGSATYEIQGTEDGTVVNVPVTGTVEAGGTLVVEWSVPDLQTGDVTGSVFYGANSAGQTGPTYLSAEACGIAEPADLATVGNGFPNVHWVLNVTGTTEGGGDLLISVDPESGAVAQGESEEITVTADATDVEPGTYEFDVVIATNDPATPTVTVGVTVTVLPTVSNEDGATPTVFALRQNYPNPFAGQTTVEYDLAEPVHVNVEIYDVTGRHVATLVDEAQSAGRYEVTWDAGSLPSGVYVYRIEAGAFSETQKTVLVR